MPTVADVSAYLDQFAPPGSAATWDNVGLLLGDRRTEVTRLLTCLTVTPAVVEEAVNGGFGMIVAHHPILFRGAKRLVADRADGRLVWPLARNGIAVYSPHSAFDNCLGGINDGIARRLGLMDSGPLRPAVAAAAVKIVVFVPDGDLAGVSDALFAVGAGIIGQYRECSFRLSGTGTFFGSEATHPTVGQKGRREEAPEWRLEVVCPEPLVGAAVSAMRKAHSYEEPAFDIYPLKGLPGSTGEGRLGRLPAAVPLDRFAELVRTELKATAVQVVGPADRPVERVAIACGSAGEFLADAESRGADVFVTGEMRFHDYLQAESAGMALVLPGHYASERPGVEELADRLAQAFPTMTVQASARESDPVRWMGK